MNISVIGISNINSLFSILQDPVHRTSILHHETARSRFPPRTVAGLGLDIQPVRDALPKLDGVADVGSPRSGA